MISSENKLTLHLRAHGYSATTPRKTIFLHLEHKEPMTMHELCGAVSGSVDRASVYRTIKLFEKTGVIQRVHFGWKYKIELSDEFQDHHHHLLCTNCGRLIAIEEHAGLEEYVHVISNTYRFELTGHQIELQGICPGCNKSMPT